MGKRYALEGTMALVAGDSVIGFESAATIRPRLYELIVSASGTPQDYSAHYALRRWTTGAGTGTDILANVEPLDEGDPAKLITSAKEVYTVEPTLAGVLLSFGLNMRATFRWVAAPGGEFVCPDSTLTGLILNCIAVSTQFTCEATIHWEE